MHYRSIRTYSFWLWSDDARRDPRCRSPRRVELSVFDACLSCGFSIRPVTRSKPRICRTCTVSPVSLRQWQSSVFVQQLAAAAVDCSATYCEAFYDDSASSCGQIPGRKGRTWRSRWWQPLCSSDSVMRYNRQVAHRNGSNPCRR